MKKYFMSILFFITVISFTSCISFPNKEIKISAVKGSSSKGYSFILENNTENEIYYYGFEENIPWIFLQFYYENEWLRYASCHTVTKLKLYSLPKDTKMALYFPMMDCIEGWSVKIESKRVRIRFPYSYNKSPIKPNFKHDQSKVEKWNNAYGYFRMPIKPVEAKNSSVNNSQELTQPELRH
jgi:hypothetical protein